MKCPNCGKEAIFVNGKYVCLDCGIEISTEQQAAQNMNEHQVFESALPTNAAVNEDPVTVEPQAAMAESIETAPNTDPATIDSSSEVSAAPEAELNPAEPVPTPESIIEPEKPVQQYYEETLKQEEASTANGSGVYDFSDDKAETISTATEEAPNFSEPTIDNLSPASPAEPSVVIPEPQKEASIPAEPASYFAPNSFDISQPTVTPEVPVISEPVAEVPVAMAQPEPIPTVEPAAVLESTSVESKTLDEMLGEAPIAVPAVGSPVSAYGASPVSEPTPSNIQKEGVMPSVESVFGNQPVSTPPSGLPTAQDFGVAPKPKVNKRPIWLMPALIAGGALIVLVGLLLTILAFSNKKAAVQYPISLDQAGINALSANISTAMQVQQGTTTDFSLMADFSKLTINDTVTDRATIEKQLAASYELNGTWYTDAEGDISTDIAVGEKADKRTYIRTSSETYIYSAATQKYTKKSGLALIGVPAVFEAEDKAALLYTTNIKTASIVAKETIDGSEYSKYELTLNEEVAKETLEVIGGVFEAATYESLNTDNLKVFVWVGNDNKLKKVALSGSLDLVADKISGTVNLTGEASYQYIDVSIDAPNSPPGADSNTGTPVSANSKSEEEGQTSSIDNKVDTLVEAKG